MSDNWEHAELRASVEAYLEMQRKERDGVPFRKNAYYRALSDRFGRTPKSYEFRMQNISYVLTLGGRELLSGLRPKRNVGTNVAVEIDKIIAEIENLASTPDLEFEVQVHTEFVKGNLEKPAGVKKPRSKISQSKQFDRDPAVKAWVLLNSKGCCECCGRLAPFFMTDKVPFLELHHVRRLADGGSDTVENAVALCPNCHRELHHGVESKTLIEKLFLSTERLRRE